MPPQINERQGIDVNWTEIFKFCSEKSKIIEINSQPQRLDLPDDLVAEGLRFGTHFIINTDSHNVPSLDLMKYGIDVARRGGLEKKDVINTLSLENFEEKL